MSDFDDFVVDDAPDFNPVEAAGDTQVIKEAFKPAVIKVKTVKGINWIFPFMSCQHGTFSETHQCQCSINAPAFIAEDACYVSNETDPKLPPTLCPVYKQKE